MQGKTVSETSVIMVRLTSPQDANLAGNVQGGVIMRLIDEAGGIVAHRHARSNAVTASVDRIDFLHPVYIGDVVTFKASMNLVGRTSMEVGVRVESENPMTGEIRHTASAFLTYVALDKIGKPLEVPPLILETDEDRRRNREAQARREARLRNRKTSCRLNT
jgi:acyl-CoA hydrolase